MYAFILLSGCDSVIGYPSNVTVVPVADTALPRSDDTGTVAEDTSSRDSADTATSASDTADTGDTPNFEVIPYDGPWSAGAGTMLEVGVHPLQVQVADVDGDGRVDLVYSWTAALFDGGEVFVNVHVQDDAGGLGPPIELEVGHSVAFAGCLLATDLDADGRADIVVGHEDGFTLFYADRGGGFGRGEDVDGAEVAALASGDLDGDGDVDLATVTLGESTTTWIRRGGDYIATASVPSATRYQGAVAVVADVDEDGRLDVAVGDGSGPFRVYLGDGAGGLDAEEPIVSRGTVSDLAVLRVDEDTTPDLVGTGNSEGVRGPSVVGWRVDAGLTVDLPFAAGLVGYPVGLAVGDLDGDGCSDLFVVEELADTGWVFFDQGRGTWASMALDLGLWPASSVFPDPNAIGDLDGDGCGDLVWRIDDDIVIAYGVC